jgi:hypothetical protein
MSIPFFSISIPTYGYNGKGQDFLNFSFMKLLSQSFKDYEIIISDHSVDSTIKDLCDEWCDKLPIKYFPNEHGRGIISPNINNAMSRCSGKWIKILFQDDFLYDNDSLQNQHDYILKNKNVIWFFSKFYHSNDGFNFYRLYNPIWNLNVWSGNNTLGCPSGLTIKNENIIFFDEGLNWFMDCDYYQRMFQKYGPPNILEKITVVNRTWGNRLTDTITEDLKIKEFKIMKSRYDSIT